MALICDTGAVYALYDADDIGPLHPLAGGSGMRFPRSAAIKSKCIVARSAASSRGGDNSVSVESIFT